MYAVKTHVCIFLLGVLLALCVIPLGAADKKQVVLIAGIKSHGPQGNRIHDYPWSVRLLKTMLENSNVREQVEVVTFFDGWPMETAALEAADTIMIIADGRDGENGREAPHLASAERVQFVDRLMKRGCGMVAFHFSTFAPDSLSAPVLDWYGGYFDWETEGEREWYSDITTMEAEVAPATPGHAVLAGVSSFTMREEFYFDIRFRPDDPHWKPIWSVASLAATKPKGRVVAWAVERADGGRGFATTCGHFYDNWQHAGFRRTLLNAIAWTAKVDIPENGVEAKFFDRDEIQAHLAGGKVITVESVETADDTVYADAPYWYKPGHPLDPAEAASIQTLPGFKAERILTVPEEFGSWTALTVDSKGRLIAAAQHRPGLYRVTPPPIGDHTAETKVEKLKGVATQMGWSHGLLYAFDSLYVTVAEENETTKTGVYRLRDTDGDDQFDQSRLLLELDASGEHGPHNIVVGPDHNSLYLICGNGTQLPDVVERRRPVATAGIDHLMPPGFDSSHHTVGGWVIRFGPDGGDWELISSGLRNSFDLAFNRAGDLFTFDSDMEWDLGMPWYRPTRICHLVSGAEFGWRGGAAKWPEHYEDSVGPVVNIGPSSPTGVKFGYGARFPARYQNALYACDWTFATIHAVHLQPHGASYRAEVEEFVGGSGLPVTNMTIGQDGALYFAVGGRRLGSAIYRVYYTGSEATARVHSDPEVPADVQALHALRKKLESLHGRPDLEALDAAWPAMGHPDRAIRFAARVAIESQPADRWRARVLAETDAATALTALLALARQGSVADQRQVLDRLARLPWQRFSTSQKLLATRVYELALARGEDALATHHPLVRRRLRPLFPAKDRHVNRELSRLLCFLGDRSVITPLLDLMASDTGERPQLGSGYFVRNPKYGRAVRDMLESAPLMDRMHHAQMLLWLDDDWTRDQRRRYHEMIADAKTSSKGGHQYVGLWNRIREISLDQVSEDQREAFESIGAAPILPMRAEGAPEPKGPSREWSLDEAIEVVAAGLEGRDTEHGRGMFAAVGCVVCHRIQGQGGAIGPDLSSIGQRFTLRDILDTTINPSKAISDQYQMMTLELKDGSTLSGRIVSRDARSTRIATNLMRPTQSSAIDNDAIRRIRPEPVSTMPSGLLDPLNEEELLDLLAYLVSGGRRDSSR